MIVRGEKEGSEVLEPTRCLDMGEGPRGGPFIPYYKKEDDKMSKPLISYAASKDCKSLSSFIDEEEDI